MLYRLPPAHSVFTYNNCVFQVQWSSDLLQTPRYSLFDYVTTDEHGVQRSANTGTATLLPVCIYMCLYIYIVTDLETICIQHTDVPKVSYVVEYVCSQIPFLLSRGRIKGVRCDFFLVRLLNLYIQRTLQQAI